MTRATLNRKLRWIYGWLGLVVLAALATKTVNLRPDLLQYVVPQATDKAASLAGGVYETLKDMATVIVGIAAVYLAGLLQRRSNFVESLEEEWRRMVATKAALITYCERDDPTAGQFLLVCEDLSRTIDTMRIAYRNVGETDELVGLYPFAPLHNMRRAMSTIDPRQDPKPTKDERKRVGRQINLVFGALRENFLEELDLEEPTTPLLGYASRRIKRPGHGARGARGEAREKAGCPPGPRQRDGSNAGGSDCVSGSPSRHTKPRRGPSCGWLRGG